MNCENALDIALSLLFGISVGGAMFNWYIQSIIKGTRLGHGFLIVEGEVMRLDINKEDKAK